jgi:hypothetical protein
LSSLLDAILGNFNSRNSGSANLPPSGGSVPPSGGYGPPNQAPELAADPYGNPVGGLAPGGLAPGMPLPRPRPDEAGPAAVLPPAAAPPDMQPDESGGTGGPGGGLAAALALDPGRAKTVMASLAGGLSNVKNSPFAGQVAANAAGGAIAGGNKAEDTAIEQAIKLQRVNQIALKRADAASERWYRDRAAALRDEQRAINQSAQTPEQKAAQYKSLQDRARGLGAEFANIKAQNRRAHGLSDDGTPLSQAAGSAARESDAPTSDEPAANQ